MGNSHSNRLPTPTEAAQLRAEREKKLELRNKKKVTKRANRELANIRKAMKAGESEIVVDELQAPDEFRQACETLIPVLAAQGFSADLNGSAFRWKTLDLLPKYTVCTCADARAF